ncbi:MAG: hypothetical protein Tsb0015_05210 [Simkaniaceae bacterium]
MEKISSFHFGTSQKSLDHLSSFSAYLSLPLYLADKELFQNIHNQYPNLDCRYYTEEEIATSFLQENDAAVTALPSNMLNNIFEFSQNLLNKKLLSIWFPENLPESSFSSDQEMASLATGQLAYAALRKMQIEKILIVGNIKYAFYAENKDFYETKLQSRLKALNKKLFTIFIASSWMTDFDFFQFIKEKIKNYNFIIPVNSLQIKANTDLQNFINDFTDFSNILFIQDFIPMHPLMAQSDIYLGEINELAYDYLIYDNPIVLTHHFANSPLQTCAASLKNFSFEQAVLFSAKKHRERKALQRLIFSEAASKKFLLDLMQTLISGLKERWIL